MLTRLLTDLVDGPAFLIFGMASSEIRLMAIFIIGHYMPAIVALQFLWREMLMPTASK